MPHLRIAGFRFEPTLWATLCAAVAFAVLVGLGAWQLERLAWKEGLLAERAARLAAPVLDEPATVDPARQAFRHARITGTFLHDKEMYLAARSMRGNVGYHVVTPLRRAGDGHVLVNRGWVPADRRDPATRRAGQVGGTVTVTGIVRGDGRKSVFSPDNDPAANNWFTVDIAAMAAHAGLRDVARWVLEADAAESPGGLPVGGQTRTELPSNHLQYAITWFGLAAALAAVYAVYHTRREEGTR